MHAVDNDILENGELRFSFVDEPNSSVAGLFAIHPYSGLMVSKYSLQLKDLRFLGSTSAIMKTTYTVKIKVPFS